MICEKCGQYVNTGTKCFQCGYDSKADELKVEHYNVAAAEAKKKKIWFKVGIGAGAVALLALLGLLGFLALRELGFFPTTVHMLGGNGAWFNSKVIFLEDENG